ncbi:MAG: DUF2200 domain-containing protein [Clostridiales bacterium]|jgi:hypothetical protein|nr:DUF2200 domain-containing protein [Clostridiales bacterium]
MDKPRIFSTPFGDVYPIYVQKAERKGRTAEEVDTVITWLTGYDESGLREQIGKETNVETFFAEAPQIHPNAYKITGKVCGVQVETITDPVMQNVRRLDKLFCPI